METGNPWDFIPLESFVVESATCVTCLNISHTCHNYLRKSNMATCKIIVIWLKGKFYGAQTRNLSRASVIEEVAESATQVVGSSYYNTIKNAFNDTKTDIQTRVSFKFNSSLFENAVCCFERGVWTPFFYVNGFLLPDTGGAVDYKTWRKVIDPLVGAKNKSIQNEESLHFFL
ncbi:hypothetical protein GmHk_06G014899 [Glycine max]|nr:hypothetical protein GmHk_06G014899 [Glycine max]